MIPTLLLASQLPTEVAERQEVAVIILTPFGSSSHTGTSRILSAASLAFERETNLRLVLASDVGVDVDRWTACPSDQRLTCWVEVASEARVSLLLVITVASSADEDRVAMTMIDLDEVRGLKEEEIFDRLAEVEPRPLSDPEETFSSVVTMELRPFLERHGRYGTSSRRVADCENCEAESTVASDVLFYGGLGAAVAGVALGVSSLVLVAAGPKQVCVGRDEASCNYVQSGRSGFGASGATPIEEVNRGFPLLPAGVGLLVAGASFVVGSLVFEEAHWWITLVSGVVLGSAATGIALAVE